MHDVTSDIAFFLCNTEVKGIAYRYLGGRFNTISNNTLCSQFTYFGNAIELPPGSRYTATSWHMETKAGENDKAAPQMTSMGQIFSST